MFIRYLFLSLKKSISLWMSGLGSVKFPKSILSEYLFSILSVFLLASLATFSRSWFCCGSVERYENS